MAGRRPKSKIKSRRDIFENCPAIYGWVNRPTKPNRPITTKRTEPNISALPSNARERAGTAKMGSINGAAEVVVFWLTPLPPRD